MPPSTDHKPPTLLVVDDDDSVLKLVCMLLRRDGHEVLAAHDGVEALTVTRSRGLDIDILLTDLRMPGLGGAELAKAVAGLFPHIRVVFMTGFADEHFEPGSVAIRKPFKPAVLKDALQRAAAQSA